MRSLNVTARCALDSSSPTPSEPRRVNWAAVATILLVVSAMSSMTCVGPGERNVQRRGQPDAAQCLEPQPTEAVAARADDLVGAFDLALYASSNVERDSVITGRLTLAKRSTVTAMREPGAPLGELYGWTTITVQKVGDVETTTAPSSTDPMRPGVLGFLRSDGVVLLTLGSAAEGGNMSLHTGITMLVRRSDPSGFRGTWEVESLRLGRPGGFFCAWRKEAN